MGNGSAPMVSVCMITYNHEAYIKQAIEGVLMQKCNFSFELIIGEDCSTDKTLDICTNLSEANEKIRLLTSTSNLGMMPNFVRTLSECTGKYIAFCEGDDYWTDPYKLQKQVDFLESNQDFGLVHTNYLRYINDLNYFENNPTKKIDSGNIFKELLKENQIATLTVMMRRDLAIDAIKYVTFERGSLIADYPLWLEISTKSKIGFINETTSVYRVLTESASHTQNCCKQIQLNRSVHSIRKEFMAKYKLYDLESYLDVRFYKELLLLGYKHNLLSIVNEGYEELKKLNGYTITFKDYLIYLRAHNKVVNKLLKFISSIKNIIK